MVVKILEYVDARDIVRMEQTCKLFQDYSTYDDIVWKRAYRRRSAGTHCTEFEYAIYPFLAASWRARMGDDAPAMPESYIWRWLYRTRFHALPLLDATPPSSYEAGVRVFIQLELGYWVQIPAEAWSDLSDAFVFPDDTLHLACLSGIWKEGKLNGPGILQTVAMAGRSEVSHYVGNFVDGVPDGDGLADSSTGCRYRGAIQRGSFHGTGAISWSTGSRYVGDFADGDPHGLGTHLYLDGTRYQGEMRWGRPEGYGRFEVVDVQPPDPVARSAIPLAPSLQTLIEAKRREPPTLSPRAPICLPYSACLPIPFYRFQWPYDICSAPCVTPSARSLFDAVFPDAHLTRGELLWMKPRHHRKCAEEFPNYPPPPEYYALLPIVLAEYIDYYLLSSVSLFESRRVNRVPMLYKETVSIASDKIRKRHPWITRASRCDSAESRPASASRSALVSSRYEGEWSRGFCHGWGFVTLGGVTTVSRYSYGESLTVTPSTEPIEGGQPSPPGWVVSKWRQLDGCDEERRPAPSDSFSDEEPIMALASESFSDDEPMILSDEPSSDEGAEEDEEDSPMQID